MTEIDPGDVTRAVRQLPHQPARERAKTLRDAAEVRKAGLLVMGAYGRTRLTERIFGGVTRKMLSDVRIPLLMTN